MSCIFTGQTDKTPDYMWYFWNISTASTGLSTVFVDSSLSSKLQLLSQIIRRLKIFLDGGLTYEERLLLPVMRIAGTKKFVHNHSQREKPFFTVVITSGYTEVIRQSQLHHL
jgi:hypothetical protein